MSTGIEWTDETWNPVTGCTKVSEGCDHCYAERITERFHGKGSFAEVKLHPERLDLPLRWRKPRMVFVNSMSDLFHDEVSLEFLGDVFAVMALASHHTFQVLTKRPGRMASLVPNLIDPMIAALRGRLRDVPPPVAYNRQGERLAMATPAAIAEGLAGGWRRWPSDNVWLGTSVETQKWADVRVPKLLDTPAAVRFLSCEPLLGPLHLEPWIPYTDALSQLSGYRCAKGALAWGHLPALDWIIAGGESGQGARPMHPDWPETLRDQCVAAGVPFFFKQWGEWAPTSRRDAGTYLMHVNGHSQPRASGTMDFPYGRNSGTDQDLVDRGHLGWTRIRRVGKKLAGRELNGRTWDEMPNRVAVPA